MNTLNGYSKTRLSDSYILTADGGHKPISDFATASGVVTALGTSGNYVTWTKNGTVNTLTVPYATNADTATSSRNLSKFIISTSKSPGEDNKLNWCNAASTANGDSGTAIDANGFPVSNNANGILWLGTHTGNYGGQLGISSNSNLYYRYASGGTFPNTWKQLAFTSDIPTVTDYYWADVKISQSSNPKTTPTFQKVNLDGLSLTKSANVLNISNSSGYIQIGPQNEHHCHLYTDLPSFYTNKPILIGGKNALHTGNWSSTITKSALGLGNVQNTAFYKRVATVNGTEWDMAGTINSTAFTIYAPTTPGTSNYILKSNGSGAPTWIDQSSITAGVANKLTTARTINVKVGGTTGTAQSFDGSSNITIPVSGMGEAYLTWGGKNISGDISPIDAAASLQHSANKFELANPDGIIIEYSTDSGATWLEYSTNDEAKVNLVSAKGTWYQYGGSSTVSLSGRLRVTLIASSMNVYTSLKKLLINCSTNGSKGCTVIVETSKNGAETTFSTIGTYDISGYSGWNSIPCGFDFGGESRLTRNTARIRLTFSHTSLGSSQKTNPKIGNINAIGTTNWACPSTIARTGHLYSYDYLGNATFPKNIITSGKITASEGFVGNASTATLASTVTVGPGSSNAYGAIVVHNGNNLYSAGNKVQYNYSTGDVKATSFTGKLNGNLVGGAKGNIIYQSATDTTAFLANPSTNGYVLKFNTSTGLPYWTSDNNTTYTLPLAASGTRGGIQIGYSESGKNYAVKLSSEKAYVYVPWTDTKVTQTNTTTNANYRVLLSNSANDNNTTEEARKSVYLTFNPQLQTLYTGNVEISGEIRTTTSGTHPKFRMWHDNTNNALYIQSGVKDGSSTSGTIHLSGINANRLNSLYLDATTTYIAGETYISGGIAAINTNQLRLLPLSDANYLVSTNSDYNQPTNLFICANDVLNIPKIQLKTDLLNVNGSIIASGEITAYSDRRLKSNIKPLENRGYIQPMTYIKDNKECIGFIAQDVQEKYPELVNDNSEYLSLNYQQYVAVLQAQIIELEKRIKELENGIRKQ